MVMGIGATYSNLGFRQMAVEVVFGNGRERKVLTLLRCSASCRQNRNLGLHQSSGDQGLFSVLHP
jgi:hypothetical protein